MPDETKSTEKVCCADCASFAMFKRPTYIGGDARSMYSHSKGPFCLRDEFAIPAHRDSVTGKDVPLNYHKHLCEVFNTDGGCPDFTPAPPAPPESAKTGIRLRSRIGAGVVAGAFVGGFLLGLLPWAALIPVGILAAGSAGAYFSPCDGRVI